MRSPARTLFTFLLVSALALPEAVLAQQAASEASPPPSPTAGLTGNWEGWARLTNDWPGLLCHYDGGAGTTSVRLELASDEGVLRGSVAIDLPAEQGSGCPPLRKRYAIGEVSTGSDTVSFSDSGGNEWTLSLRRSGSVLQGLLAWRPGGTQQPLAEGFARPDGVRPMARLGGEVRLVRSGAPGETEASAAGALPSPTPSAPKKGGGSGIGAVAAVIGANVVGLAALWGVNKLGKKQSASGAVTCSPRFCYIGAPNSPCLCPQNSSNVLSGASCGTTPAGQPLGGTCDEKDNPCQSGLSCNSIGGTTGTCQDQSGQCPY